MKRMIDRVAMNIVDQLYWDCHVDESAIRVSVRKGRAVLTGQVPTSYSKQKAKQLTLHVPGVKTVINKLKIKSHKPVVKMSDTRIKKNIQKIFAMHPDIQGIRINVKVHSGTVVLEGRVANYWESLQAQKLAAQTEWVWKVVNRLEVESQEHHKIFSTE